jgi:uncharacterized iron-regulated membrane protein
MKTDPLAALFAIALLVVVIVGVILWQVRAVDNFYFPKEAPRESR